MKKCMFLMIISLIFALSGLSSAEEDKGKSKASVMMDEVVVSSTKTEEKRADIPNAVILLNEMDIQESPAESLGELLANELGIEWRTYGDYGGATEEISIRGLDSSGTQVLLNGIIMNSPSLGFAGVGNLPLNRIEKIEVVKGSGSLLYGSGAMGGTINITTKKPKRDETTLKGSAGYGSNNRYQLSAEHGRFAFEDFGYFLTANREEADGFRDNGDLTQNDGSLKLVLDKGEDLYIDLYADYQERDYGIPGVKPPAGTADYYVPGTGTKFYNADSASLVNRGANKDARAVFQIKGKMSEWLSLRFRQDYSDLESYNLNRNPAAAFPKLAGEGEKTWVTNQVATTEGIMDIKPIEGANLIIGGEYKGFDYENKVVDVDTNGADKPGTITIQNHHVFTKGVYVEGQYRFSRYLKGIAGVRQEKHSTFGNATLPRYGLVINPHENTTVKLSHGKQFKAPTLNDLYWPNGTWTRGNPNLKPEKGWHSDATLEQSFFNNNLFLTLSYFKWDIEDKISWAENPNFPTVFPGWNKWTPSNVDKFKSEGMEIGAKIGPIKDMIFSFDYTYTDAVEQKLGGPERSAVEVAKDQFKGSIVYWMPFGLTLTGTVRYISDRPANYLNNTASAAQNTLDSYWTGDINAVYQINANWGVSLVLGNIWDEEYDTDTANFRDQTTATTTREGYPGAGRSAFISLTYEY